MRQSGRGKKVRRTPDLGHRKWGELARLAERLNMFGRGAGPADPEEQDRYTAWRIIEEIVSSKSLAHAAEQFTALAAAHPIRLEVHMGRATRESKKTEPLPVLAIPLDEMGFALDRLWRSYFHGRGWTRLKQCPICQTWFVDPTSDKRKERCSVPCTNRWWSYRKRKEAGYSRFKKGAHHGTKGR